MKTSYFIITLILLPFLAISQTFEKKFTWKDNTFQNVTIQWVDVDNDSLLDVLVSGQIGTTTWQLKVYANKFPQQFTESLSTKLNYAVNAITYSDVNRDNYTDITITGKNQNGADSFASLINQKNLTFGTTLLNVNAPATKQFVFHDLDNDGQRDLITYSDQSLKILKAQGQTFTSKFDSAGIVVSGIQVIDFNNDGESDVIVAGSKSNQPVLFSLINKGNFKFTKAVIPHTHSGIVESGDFNHDGKFDLIVSGVKTNGDRQTSFLKNTGENFQAFDSILNYAATELLSTDLNSDGLTDLSLSGKREDGKHFNFIRQNNQSIISLDTTELISQRFGDYDRDGDLDLLRVIDSASYKVFQVFENTTPEVNARPSVPSQGFAISTPYKTFIYWGRSTDDHTTANALTYDLYLANNSGSTIIAPDFVLSSQKRKIVAHGLQGTNNFAMIKGLTDQKYNYLIQAVDNAFNGSSCIGGNILPCFTISHDYMQACKGNTITLKTEEPAYWFSNRNGFLKWSADLEFKADATDTLYSFIPKEQDCSKNKIWIIHVNEDNSKSEKETKYACDNTEFKIGIAPGWNNVLWTVGQETASGDTITLKITQATTITVKASNDAGCSYEKEFNIKISKPVLSLNGETFTISKGQSVNLSATGADTYSWQPSTGLSNAMIANPVASPLTTTEYIVTGTDSVGCKATAKATVNVQERGFIPNLFTPNGDGKNDELKIYGITEATHFKFSVFSREGTIMYETKDVNQASRNGWNGMHGGNIQNSGLYYWKVEGNTSTGEALTLNGKASGSVLLVK